MANHRQTEMMLPQAPYKFYHLQLKQNPCQKHSTNLHDE